MVVVAIIAILLMLVIPNIRTMREKAWSAQCQNNLRQYGVAMNVYMAAGSWFGGSRPSGKYNIETDVNRYQGIEPRNASGSSGTVGPPLFNNIAGCFTNVNDRVTISSLSAGQPSVRVCPAVLQMIKKEGNFFDPNAPNFKGNSAYADVDGQWVRADFENGNDGQGNIKLSPDFSTYAINPEWIGYSKSKIPENVIAYIDWNAKEGWWATLRFTNSTVFQFTSPDDSIIQNVTPKWTNAWWLTEVGFYHRIGNECGANYVAMDGHVGWISSNKITQACFTNSLGSY